MINNIVKAGFLALLAFSLTLRAEEKIASPLAELAGKTAIAEKKETTRSVTPLLDYLNKTNDFEADFTQKTYGGRVGEERQGHLWLARKGKFYLDYQKSDAQKIISNGKKIWQYDIDLEQISVRDRNELVGDTALRVLSGEVELAQMFTITAVSQDNIPASLKEDIQSGDIYRLKPKKNNTEIDVDEDENIWIVMQSGVVSTLVIDADMQETVIHFNNIKRNRGISAEKFEFIPPKGVDVIGN